MGKGSGAGCGVDVGSMKKRVGDRGTRGGGGGRIDCYKSSYSYDRRARLMDNELMFENELRNTRYQ